MTEEREPLAGEAPETDAPQTEQPSTEPDTGSVDGAEAGSTIDDAAEAAENLPTDGAAEAGVEEAGTDPEAKVAELTADLQRLQAEFLNYKRRVDRDRELIKQNAAYAVLAPVTEVLDTIDRAREHGPLDDGLKAVADQLERVVAAQGLTKFGEVGETFDPTLHEALSHLGSDPEVAETTVKVVAKAGYRIGDRVVRAAQVLVVDPE